jgi:Clostripain family.
MKDFFTAKSTLIAALAALMLVALPSCRKDDDFDISGDQGAQGGDSGSRKEYVETRRVLLFYVAGFNSLYSYVQQDMDEELVQSPLPEKKRSADVLLVYSKIAATGSYAPVKSYLRRIYKDSEGKVASDTLLTIGADKLACSPETMSQILTFVKQQFPAREYGMIYSSHGSGWLPEKYYYSPSTFESNNRNKLGIAPRGFEDIPSGTMADDPFAGMVRSIGVDEAARDNTSSYKELTNEEFASGIPFKLDYLLFDMCLSAGVEAYYALRDKADVIGGSPAEVLGDGMFDYTKITSYLFNPDGTDLEGLYRDSFNRYDIQTDPLYRSATASLVESKGMNDLADVCKMLFEKYRSEIASLNYRSVQGFYRLDRHYFFDLEDVFIKCGASQEDLTLLRNAMGKCVIRSYATPSFMKTFDIDICSGMTTYLPSGGTALLNRYYREEAWNKATEFVK